MSPRPRHRWVATTLPLVTAAIYAAALDDLSTSLVAWHHPERHGTRQSRNNGSARCPCSRRIRVT
jgi:hypothetical protein